MYPDVDIYNSPIRNIVKRLFSLGAKLQVVTQYIQWFSAVHAHGTYIFTLQSSMFYRNNNPWYTAGSVSIVTAIPIIGLIICSVSAIV